jgi:O-antigen/teichoic acid export membrane protein
MRQTDKIIKDSTVYTISTIVSQVIGIFTSIAMRRFLTPEMMGIWATFLVVLNYALFTNLGIFTAIEIKIPYLRGKNENDELLKMRNIAFTLAIILSIIMTFVLLAASFVLAPRMRHDAILGIRVMALIIIATFFYNLYITMVRADKEFSLLSKVIVFNSLATLLFVSALTYFFNLKGIYFATLLATLASWFYIQFKAKYDLKLYFDIRLIRSLAKIGLSFVVIGIIYTALLSIDKLMIIKMLGPAQLGYYSIAMLAFTYANNFPKLFSIVIFPTMQEEFGRNDSRKNILGYVKQPTMLTAYLFPLVLAAAYFAIPVLVYYVLPKYALGINSMKVLLAGCFFMSLVPLSQNFVVSLNKQAILIPMTAAAVLLGIGLNYSLIKMGYGITGVALGVSITYFLYFAVTYFYVLYHCEKLFDICRSFLAICAPFIYSVAIILILERFVKMNSVIIKSFVQAMAFCLAYSPMLWYINRRMRLIPMLFRKSRIVLPKERLAFNDIRGEE